MRRKRLKLRLRDHGIPQDDMPRLAVKRLKQCAVGEQSVRDHEGEPIGLRVGMVSRRPPACALSSRSGGV